MDFLARVDKERENQELIPQQKPTIEQTAQKSQSGEVTERKPEKDSREETIAS